MRGLSNRADGLFTEAEQRLLQDSTLRMPFTLNYWAQYPDPALAAQAQRDCAGALSQAYKMLDRSTQVERVWAVSGAPRQTMTRHWPLGSGVVLLRIGRNDATDPGPRLVRGQYDLSRSSEATVDVGGSEITYAALYFSKAPEGEKHVIIKLRAGAAELGSADLAITTLPTGTLRVSIVDPAPVRLHLPRPECSAGWRDHYPHRRPGVRSRWILLSGRAHSSARASPLLAGQIQRAARVLRQWRIFRAGARGQLSANRLQGP